MSSNREPGEGKQSNEEKGSGSVTKDVAQREMIFQSPRRLAAGHLIFISPLSFVFSNSLLRVCLCRSALRLWIIDFPPSTARDRLSLATSNPFCRFSAIFSHPPRSFTRVCWSSQGKKHKSRRDGGRASTGSSHTCVYVFPCYFLRYVFAAADAALCTPACYTDARMNL